MDIDIKFREDLEVSARQLNAKQVAWIAEYLVSNSVREANKKVGISGGSLLKVPTVIEVVAKERQAFLYRKMIDAERVAEELRAIAQVDPLDLFNEDGTCKPITEVPEHARRAIAGIERTEVTNARTGETTVTWRYRLWEKNKANELLGKWLKMWTDKMEIDDLGGLAERLTKAREQAGLKELAS